MTVYARSDVMSVALSSSHGGCGAAHHRPVTRGAPAAVWALTCPPCEDHLRHDPLWAVMPADVPETPDEERVREDRDKKGALDRDRLLSDAIVALASSQESLPAQLAQALMALTGRSLPAATVEAACPRGHPTRADARFCGECGERLESPEDAPPPAVVDAPVVEPAAPPGASVAELQQLTVRELRELARARDLEDAGNKAQLVERLAGR